MAYRLLADAILFVHFAFVVFVVLGLVAVILGGMLGWRWVRNRTLRVAHLVAIAVVVGQSWLGVVCPLTTLEMWARRRAGDATYDGEFVAHWVDRILFWSAPDWVFVVAYTAFGAAVLASWALVPPKRPAVRQSPDRRA